MFQNRYVQMERLNNGNGKEHVISFENYLGKDEFQLININQDHDVYSFLKNGNFNINHLGIYFFSIKELDHKNYFLIPYDLHFKYKIEDLSKILETSEVTQEVNQQNNKDIHQLKFIEYYCLQYMYFILNNKDINFEEADPSYSFFSIIAGFAEIYKWSDEEQKKVLQRCYELYVQKSLEEKGSAIKQKLQKAILKKKVANIMETRSTEYETFYKNKKGELFTAHQFLDIFLYYLSKDRILLSNIIIWNIGLNKTVKQERCCYLNINLINNDICLNINKKEQSVKLELNSLISISNVRRCNDAVETEEEIDETDCHEISIHHLSVDTELKKLSSEPQCLNINFTNKSEKESFLYIISKLYNIYVNFWDDIISRIRWSFENNYFLFLRKLYKQWECAAISKKNDVHVFFREKADGQCLVFHDPNDSEYLYLAIYHNELKFCQLSIDMKFSVNDVNYEFDDKRGTVSCLEDLSREINLSLFSIASSLGYNPFKNALAESSTEQYAIKDKYIINNQLKYLSMKRYGKFGEVSKAVLHLNNQEQIVAVKKFFDLKKLQDIMSMADAYCRLPSHPNICEVFGFTLAPQFQLISQWMDSSLHNLLLDEARDYDFLLSHVINVLQQVSQGFHFLRDKPYMGKYGNCHLENILVSSFTADGIDVKLSDPGCESSRRWPQNSGKTTLFRRNPTEKLFNSTDILDLACSAYLLFYYHSSIAEPRRDVAAFNNFSQQTGVPSPKMQQQPENCPKDLYELLYHCRSGWDLGKGLKGHQTTSVLLITPLTFLKQLVQLESVKTGRFSNKLVKTTVVVPKGKIVEPQFETTVSLLSPKKDESKFDESFKSEYYLQDKDLPGFRDSTEHLLGKGAFGIAYKAWFLGNDPRKWENVAIKVIKFSNQEKVRDVIDKFEAEAIVQSGLVHENILSLLKVNPDKCWLVTKYMNCGDLKEDLKSRKKTKSLHIRNCYNIINSICKGMLYLESKNMYHRDLACRNVLVHRSGDREEIRISDFGLAGEFKVKGQPEHGDGAHECWTAPETLPRKSSAGYQRGIIHPKSDVWSLAVVIWEVLTGGVDPSKAYMASLNQYFVVENREFKKEERQILQWLSLGKEEQYTEFRLRLVDQPMQERGGTIGKKSFIRDEWKERSDMNQIWKIAHMCWRFEPADRPSFHDLVEKELKKVRLLHRVKTSSSTSSSTTA